MKISERMKHSDWLINNRNIEEPIRYRNSSAISRWAPVVSSQFLGSRGWPLKAGSTDLTGERVVIRLLVHEFGTDLHSFVIQKGQFEFPRHPALKSHIELEVVWLPMQKGRTRCNFCLLCFSAKRSPITDSNEVVIVAPANRDFITQTSTQTWKLSTAALSKKSMTKRWKDSRQTTMTSFIAFHAARVVRNVQTAALVFTKNK